MRCLILEVETPRKFMCRRVDENRMRLKRERGGEGGGMGYE